MDDEFRLIGVGSNRQIVRENRLRTNGNLLSGERVYVLLLAELLLTLNIIIGDYYIFESDKLIVRLSSFSGLSERMWRAAMDNFSHFFVAAMSWFIISYRNGLNGKELLISGSIGSLIDVDHFITAKSFYLKDAISLSGRPFFHNSSTLLVVNLIILGFGTYVFDDGPVWRRYSCLFFIAWFSHHVRDANRRGLWFGGSYSTRPIKFSLYLSIILLLPLLLRYAFVSDGKFRNFNLLNSFLSKNKSQSYIVWIKTPQLIFFKCQSFC